MMYLSQLLGKTVYFQKKPFGKIIDLAVFTNRPQPPISKIEIKRDKKKLTISPDAVKIVGNHIELSTPHIPLLPYDHKDFYLSEDLMDKQVIDMDGRRLVRVNDVVLDNTEELKVAGIEIGFYGVLHRLGLSLIPLKPRIIPWQFIEAFDYQTGNVQIKLTQNKLNSLHPSELADILEDVGTKERLGIVAALDANKAARAIEEADNQTQISILEELPVSGFKEVLTKMHTSELADILNYLNPLKNKEIQEALGVEKANRVKKLLSFSEDTAGGLMHPTFLSFDSAKTVKETLKALSYYDFAPETILVTNGGGKLAGTVKTKDLIHSDQIGILRDIVKDRQFVSPDKDIQSIFKIFAEYNLRALPVVDKEKKPIGIISIDDLLKRIEEQNQQNETI
ncbi:MAG TPA: CBS domain-containing protein [Patescibacteria group bacterium]